MFITPSAGLGSPHQNVLSSAEPEVRGVLPLLFSGSSDLCGLCFALRDAVTGRQQQVLYREV